MKKDKIPVNKTRKIFWAALGTFFIVYLFLSLAFPAGQTILIRDLFYVIMGFLTVSILVFTAYKVGNKDRRLWTFIAVGGFFWMAGDLAYRVAEALGYVGPDRLLSFADIPYLAAYAAFICAIQTMGRITTRRPRRGLDWIGLYPLFVVVGALGLSLLMAKFMPHGVGVLYDFSAPITIPAIVNYLYPALDIGLICGLLMIILTHVAPFRKTWQELVLFGLVLFTLADMNYSVTMPAGIYDPANLGSRLIIAMWLLGDILVFMAAIYRLTETSERIAVSGKVADNSLVVPR